MKNKFLIFLILLIGCSNNHKEYTIEEFMDITSFGGSSFSYDEKSVLIRSNESGINNAFEIDLSSLKSQQLTFSDSNSISPISYFPNDKRFLFRSDQGGNEIWHIYLFNIDGTTIDLTPGKQSRSLFLKWANDKKSFFYTSNKRNPKFMDLYEMSIDSFKSTLVFKNDDALNIGDVSKNKKYLALSKTYTRDNSDIY